MQEKLKTGSATLKDTDTVGALQETPSEEYKKSGALAPINTALTVLCRPFPHQQEINKLPKKFSMKGLHV